MDRLLKAVENENEQLRVYIRSLEALNAGYKDHIAILERQVDERRRGRWFRLWR